MALETESILRITGIALSLTGTVILAWRVNQILSELIFAVTAHDLNFQVRAQVALERSLGYQYLPHVQMVGCGERVERVKASEVKLLILGFGLQIAGGVCQALAWLDAYGWLAWPGLAELRAPWRCIRFSALTA